MSDTRGHTNKRAELVEVAAEIARLDMALRAAEPAGELGDLLRKIVGEAYNLLTQGESPTQRRQPSAQAIYDYAYAAKPLLASLLAALDRLVAERDEARREVQNWRGRYAGLQDVARDERFETAHFVKRCEQAEAEVARLTGELAAAHAYIGGAFRLGLITKDEALERIAAALDSSAAVPTGEGEQT